MRGDSTLEIAGFLSEAGMKVVSPGHTGRVDIVVTFSDEPSFGTPGMRRMRLERRGSASESANGPADADFMVGSPIHAASRILSWCFATRVAMLTEDPATFWAIASAIKAAQTDVPIMIEGETGTGKGMLAQLVHAASGGSGDLVAVNCSMLGDGQAGPVLPRLAERLRRAGGRDAGFFDSPTVFLDNVHELSRAMQRRILGEMRSRVKDGSPFARFVASSIQPVDANAKGCVFEPEFYAAFGRVRVVLPPLRDRPRDIPLLACEFLATCDGRLRFAPSALRVLAEYPFPGNVREMENLVRRLAIVSLRASGTIEASDVRTQIIVATLQKTEKTPPNWRAAVQAAKREVALRTVSALGGDVDAAAQRLGLSVASLRRSMRLVEVTRVTPR